MSPMIYVTSQREYVAGRNVYGERETIKIGPISREVNSNDTWKTAPTIVPYPILRKLGIGCCSGVPTLIKNVLSYGNISLHPNHPVISNSNDKKWLVRWLRDPPSESWERYDNLKNVEAFHHYCATNRLDPFLPKPNPTFSASVPNMYRRTAFGQFAPPVAPSVHTNDDTVRNDIIPTKRKRGRPKKTV